MTTTATESQVIPRFRSDLVTQPVDEAGQRFVDVTDPDSGSTFRFYEVEYAIACAMDGNRDVTGLASWALEELGLETSSNELETVISTLGDLGYLDSQAELEPAGLGVAGGSSPVATSAPQVEAAALELGLPGKSAAAPPRPVAPAAEDVDLGTPGAAALAAPTPPLTAPVAESASFAGLLDDEPPTDVPARVRPDRLPTADEPTQVRSDSAANSAGSPRLPAADDFGLDGITPPPAEVPMPNLRPVTEPSSDDDGPTNLPPPAPGLEEAEVSVDLSEHLSIDASDLKEAVRQSQVMQAVDVPADLLAELEDKEPGGAAPLPVAPVESKPIELPSTRAKVSASSSKPSGAVEPPATEAPSKSGVSPILLVLFLLVLAGGAAVWYFKVYKPKQDEKNAANSGAATANKAPANKLPATKPNGPANKPAKPAKKDISAELVEQAAEGAVVALAADAQVTWIAADGSDIAAGDIVAKLRGVDRLEKKLANVESRKMHYQAKLDKVSAKLAKAGPARTPLTRKLARDVATFKAKVAEKEAAAARFREGAAAFLIAAPVAGKVTQKAKAGAWLKKGAAIAEITGSSKLVATFDIPDSKTLDEGSSVSVQAGGKTIECLVAAVAGPKATVACPVGSAPAGTTITLK